MFGHAMDHCGRTVHRLLQVVIAVTIIAAALGGALAWRLAQGPLEIGWLTRRLEAAANAPGGPPALVIGSAALAWEGFTRGVGEPLDIRLTGVALRDAAGAPIAEIPRAEVSLSAGWLVLGRIVPRELSLEGVRLRAQRAEDGRVSVDLGRQAEDAGEPGSLPAGERGVLAALLQELARPTATSAEADSSLWSQLRRVRIHDAALVVDDRQLGASWRASQVGLDVVRGASGGAEATAEMALTLGDERVQVTASASLPPGGTNAAVEARMSPVSPARLAALAPGLAVLRAVQAPLALSATATVGADINPRQVKLQARLGAGRLLVGKGSMPLVSALVEVEGTPAAAMLWVRQLELAPRPDGPRTVLRGSIKATRADGRLDATIAGTLDQAAFADLAELWPVGVGGPGTRPWIIENMTSGVARNGHFELRLTGTEDLSDVTVTSLAGGLDGQDLTVHWLRPVPPLEHGNARLTFLSPDELEIAVTSGRQAGGALAVQSGRLLITGLTVRDQFMTIEADLAGPVADLLTVLKHPRLQMLDRRPIEMRDPAGTVAGRLTITRLPLEFKVTLDDVHIRTTGKLTRLHLGAIAAGRDLDQGTLDFEANNDGLKLRGNAQLGGIAAQMQVDMDFRDGGPAQVLEKVGVTGTATAAQLDAAGLPTGGLLDGPAALQAAYQIRRDGRGEIAVHGDLGRAVLAVPRLNFRKPAGQPASADIHVALDHDHIAGIDKLRLDGEGIAVAGRVAYGGGSARAVRLDRFHLGEATDASGDVQLPAQPGAPWVATLAGRSIDASAEFRHGDAKDRRAADEPDRTGPPWRVNVHFDRVVLGEAERVLNGVAGNIESDGVVIRRGKLSGATGAGAAFQLEIAPAAGGRTLSGSAADAGRLLHAFGLVDNMNGGRLTLQGRYDDRAPGHPLQGSAEIADFRMRNAPALAKLLQAMTLYGLVEVLQGSGLGFNRLIAPFRLSRDVLELADARAFSASLGMTAKGRIDLARNGIAVEGTIVPAYFFNTLLGEIPLVGRLFSPERGGGLFAATYSLRGSLDDPAVVVNPLAALTPGFLRGLFGIFDKPSSPSVSPPSGQQQGGSGN